MSDTSGIGYQTPGSSADRFRALSFIVRQILGSDVRTAEPAVVLSVTGGGIAIPPVVSVQVLVNQVDGLGNATPHGQIYNVPVFRLQCGNGAIICDPIVNDTGLLVVCDRDISSVQSTGGMVSNPGSSRRFDLSDSVFLPGLFGAKPTQYFQFTTTGLSFMDVNGNSIITGTGGITVTTVAGGDFTVNGIKLTQHVHGGVTIGGGTTAPPTPGT